MKLLLAAGGVTNPSIHAALVQLLGKPIACPSASATEPDTTSPDGDERGGTVTDEADQREHRDHGREDDNAGRCRRGGAQQAMG